MAIHVIDNKRLDLTSDEFEMYTKICRSYDRQNAKGEDLFRDLFETDNNGIIIFLKPPSRYYTSMEIFLFLAAVMQHQHLRVMHEQIDEVCASLKKKIDQKD